MYLLKIITVSILFPAMTLISTGSHNTHIEAPGPVLINHENPDDEDSRPEEPGPVRWQDVAGWKYIPGGSVTISNDGQWFAYWYSPNKGNSELILKSTANEEEHSYDIGEIPSGFGSAGAINFSHDSKYMAFLVYPSEEEKEKSKDGDNPVNKLSLIDLGSKEETTFDNVKSFSFSEENPGWLAVHLTTPKASGDKDAGKGTDLLLFDSENGNTFNFGNVSAYAFNKKGNWLAWINDAHGKAGNGIRLRNMKTGEVLSPESDKADYQYLNWTKEGDGLAVLKGKEDEEFTEDVYSVIGLSGFDKGSPGKVIYNPHEDPGFPDEMTISPNRGPYWSDNLNSLFFGIHSNEKEEKAENDTTAKASNDTINVENDTITDPAGDALTKNTDEKPDLVLWHWQDKRLQSVQKNRQTQDKNYSYLSVYHVSDNKFIRLADDDVRTINVAPKQKYALGIASRDYELWGSMSGENYADIYTITLATGKKEMILGRHRMLGGLHMSPDGEKFIYYSEGNYYSTDFPTRRVTNITENIPALFVNVEFDRNIEFPPTPFWGWTSDSREVLIRDNWNVWKVSSDGNKYENISLDGERNGKRYQYRFTLDPDEEGIDLEEPLFMRVFDENTKKSGIARIDRGRSGPKVLLWDDASHSNLRKAKNKDVFFFTRETATTPPDHYSSASIDLSDFTKMTEIFPERENYMLSPGSRLISFISDKGDTLQAALFLPAGYVEGKEYPTVVYIYERLTQGLNSYSRPSFPGGGFNRAMYTSNGYAVLMPDIAYQLNDPGMSAVWCVMPAVEAAIETGIADPDNIAIHGHSWGGYQTSFLITQTDRFKAAVAGAPLTNMISMYSLIYWNTGSTNQPIFETSQGRLTSGYWDNWEAFKRNSPVYYAGNVNTPLLLMHNDKDGAVDFTQGIEYYNTLRRLEKPVIMLQYEGENHGLRKTSNQIDYAVRMMEYLDHYLKGKDAPSWLKEGVPLLDMKKHLEERPAVLTAQ
jgi:dipeptidyl aminopeptidase/acylaminoacyl peptidase